MMTAGVPIILTKLLEWLLMHQRDVIPLATFMLNDYGLATEPQGLPQTLTAFWKKERLCEAERVANYHKTLFELRKNITILVSKLA